jgi:RNA polymerase sigma factor (sigma-70 family)
VRVPPPAPTHRRPRRARRSTIGCVTTTPVEDRAPISELVLRARRREPGSWEDLVNRCERVVWKAVNMVSDDQQIRADAFATTWLRLTEHLDRIDPERLLGWLATVATNEARRLGRLSNRYALGRTDDEWERTPPTSTDRGGEEHVLERELSLAVRAAFGRLDPTCRELLTLLLITDPPLGYPQIEAHFGRPHGWVGPTRGRCLDKLRRMPELVALNDGEQRA